MSETPIRMIVGGNVLTAQLVDSPTARDLVARLPVTLTFMDYNGVEKVAPLDEALSLEGAPEGADPDIGDIAYYVPLNNLVLYYGDVSYWPGIVPIGRFDTSLELIEIQTGDFEVTIERGGHGVP
jgi:hypothetical protein